MATETITITALFRDAATEGITRVESSLTRVGSRLTALNAEMSTRGQQALGSFKTGLGNLGQVVDGVGKRLDGLIEKLGDRLWHATKIGVAGVVGLGAAFVSMAWNIEKEVANAQVTLSNFMSTAQHPVSPDSPQVVGMVRQMHQFAWVASLQAQTQGMQQLLVNPLYRSQAPQMQSALLALAARNPANAETTYQQLSGVMARIEQQGRVNPRAALMLSRAGISTTDLAQQMGINLSTPAGNTAFNQVMSQSMPVNTFLGYVRGAAQRQAGWDPTHPGALSGSEQTALANSPTMAQSYAKNQISVAVADALDTKEFNKAILGLTGPLSNMIGILSKTIVPPVISLLTSVVDVANRLMPAIGPLLGAFSGGLATAVGKIQPFVPMLTRVGKQFATAFQNFLTAAMPLIPAFFAGLLALLQLMPPFLTVATPAIWALSNFLNVVARLAAVATSITPVAYILAGAGAALVTIAAAAKAGEVLKSVSGWLAGIGKAEGFWGKIRAGAGIGGDKATQKIAKSTVAEMTVDVMNVRGEIGGGGGGGGGGPLGKAGRKGERDAEGTLERDAAGAAEGAAGGGMLRRLFPTLFRAGGALKGLGLSGLGKLADLKDTARIRGWYGLDKVRGVLGLGGGEEAGGLLGTAGMDVGAAGAGALAGTAGLGAAAGAASYLGTTYLLNHLVGGNTVRNWFGMGDAGKPSTHLTHQTQDFTKEFMRDNKTLIDTARKQHEGWAKANDPYAVMHFYNSLSPAQQAAMGWVNPSRPGGGGVAPAHVTITGPVTVVANDPVSLQKALAAKAQEAQRRGARQPTGPGNQGNAARINQGRPVS